MKNKKKSKKGGVRQGAGRPALFATPKMVAVNLEQALCDWLDAKRGPGETRSSVVRRILEDARGQE